MQRREFLRQSAGLVITLGVFPELLISKKLWADPFLPIPNIHKDNILKYEVCVRPYREKGIRLEKEVSHNKAIVHNYGHGGAGMTLSWGCAEMASEMITRGLPFNEKIAVLGAGVMGLSTATVLIERGYRVKIYAKQFTPHTTSDHAGGNGLPPVFLLVKQKKI